MNIAFCTFHFFLLAYASLAPLKKLVETADTKNKSTFRDKYMLRDKFKYLESPDRPT